MLEFSKKILKNFPLTISRLYHSLRFFHPISPMEIGELQPINQVSIETPTITSTNNGESQNDDQFQGKIKREKKVDLLKLLKEKEVSKVTRRAVQTLRNDRHHGRGIPYIKNGRSVLYRLDDVLDYINVRRISTSDAD